jgi:hypothetical protein
MRRFRVRAVHVAVVVAAAVAAPAPAAAQSAPATSFVWKVEGASVMYLAGSVHALGPDAYPLHPAFDRAFEASTTLVEELDLGEMASIEAGVQLLGKGLYQDGRTLDQTVSRDTFARLTGRLGSLPVEMVRRMKPWMAALTLAALTAQQAGLDAGLGLDKHFFDRAAAAGKTVVGLETAALQIDTFDRMPEPVQEHLLRTTLDELDSSSDRLTAVVAAWRRGDSAGIERTLLAEFAAYPDAYRALIVDRNVSWMPRLEACLAGQSCFVVVGAAHLVGPDGLLALLQKRGYTVQQQ